MFSDLTAQSRPGSSIFVGRTRELAELQAALETTCAGHGQLILLAGEPGIGKTRLAEEFATVARQRDVRVLWGRCWEGDGAPAFWPWVQIVRTYVQHSAADTLAAEMGGGATDIAQIVSEVRERLPDLPAPSELEPQQARFRFFDSLTTFFKRAASTQVLALILDDLHWADAPSLLLLHFLARELYGSRLLVVGTYRDVEVDRNDPLAEMLGALARESQQITLSGLALKDVAHFIETTTGAIPAPSLVTAVYDKTEGNPFFVNEITRLLDGEGRLTSPEGTATWASSIPQGVRETIRRRLTRLSDGCIRLLMSGAVIGREFSLELLDRVRNGSSNVERGQLLALLHEARVAHVISEVPSDAGRYRFVHALIRETLYEDLSLPERLQRHCQIGEAMEGLYAAHLEPYLAELADHFWKAAPGGTVDKAIQYAIQAGERATALLAYEEAAGYYANALQLLPLQESTEAQRGELLLALGDAQVRAGETKKSRATFSQTAAIARKLSQQHDKHSAASLLARAALGFAGRGDVPTRLDQQMVSLLEEACAALPETDSALRVRVLARLAIALYFSPFAARCDELSQQAVAMARRLGDPTILASALNARHIALIGPDTVAERLALATELIRLAEAEGRKDLAAAGHVWRLMAVLELGDRVAADQELQTYGRLAEELRQPFYRWQATVLRAMRALLEGRFEEGEQLVQEGLALGQRLQTPNAFLILAVQLFSLRREQGRLQELEDALKSLAERYPAIPSLRSALGFIYSELGRETEARSEFERLAAKDFIDFQRDQGWFTGMAHLSQVAFFLQDTRRAAMLYERLSPYAGRNIVVGSATDCYGPISRYLGLLATLLQRWEDAEQHFTAAIAMTERLRARPFLAHTQYEYACVLLARGQPGDRERALELLDLALATAQELGMKSLEEKIGSQVQGEKSLQSRVRGLESKNQSFQFQRVQTLDARPQTLDISSQSPASNTFHQEGAYWTVGYEGTVVRLDDTKGLYHIAHLLREPGREFHVMDLLAMTDKLPPTASFVSSRAIRAMADESLTVSGAGHHARERTAEAEKARKAVANRIRTALTKIKRVHPALWRHLFTALKTGTFCSYTPEQPTSWEF